MLNIVVSPENLKEGGRYVLDIALHSAHCYSYKLHSNLPTEGNCVLVCGDVLNSQLGIESSYKWRGSVLPFQGRKVVIAYSPSMVNKQYHLLPLLIFDIKKAMIENQTPSIQRIERKTKVLWAYKEVQSLIAHLCNQEYVSYDLETTGQGIPTAIGFAYNKFEGFSFPLTGHWTLMEEALIWRQIKQLFEQTNVKFIAQNAQFDNFILWNHPSNIRVKNLWLDTMCLAHFLHPGLPKDLGTLCTIYTDMPYYKHWIHEEHKFYEYNATDAMITWEISFKMLEDANTCGMDAYYFKYVHPLFNIFFDVQLRGVKIDMQKLLSYREKCQKKLAELQAELDNILGFHLNCLSPKQLKEALYERLGLPKQYKRGSESKITTDEEALQNLSKKFPGRKELSLILDIRKYNKLLGTYLNPERYKDGRARCLYHIAGTVSGRLSSSKTYFGEGGNLQNIPPSVRDMFIPDKGKIFIILDLKQAEAYTVAYFCGGRLWQIFQSGQDVYKQIGSWIFGKKVEEITHDERQLAKKCLLALNYGMGVRTFAYHIDKPLSEAKALREKYFTTFSEIRKWHQSIEYQLRKNRTLITPFGFRRQFYQRWGNQLFREAYDFLPQATVACYTNYGIIRLLNRFPETELLMQTHDEIVIQVPEEEVEAWKQRVREAYDFDIKGLKIPYEMRVNKSWAK